MNSPFLTLRHLCFTGPDKDPAILKFGPGLNLIYGASETGKSFVLEAIDFMLGAKQLREIPERDGYDRIWLGIELEGGEQFTLERSPQGAGFRCYNGLVTSTPEGQEPLKLGAKHSTTNDKNISAFLLSKIGLSGKKLLFNKTGTTHGLSFRNLAHLLLVSEQDIQKRESPIHCGQYTDATKEKAAFKLLLSGVDDSAVEPEPTKKERQISTSAKSEVIDQIISEHRVNLKGLIGDEDEKDELQEQLNKLEVTLADEHQELATNEGQYRGYVSKRRQLRLEIEKLNERNIEISEMLKRFELLDEHYRTDLERLDGISEAGTLLNALSRGTCPLCGALPENQNGHSDCDGNVEGIADAAHAEKEKIIRLRKELSATVAELQKQFRKHEDSIPSLEEGIEAVQMELVELEPIVSGQRNSYSEIVDKISTVRRAISILGQIDVLEKMKSQVSLSEDSGEEQEQVDVGLSPSILDEFSQCYQDILQSWNFPDAERTHFDSTTSDFIIAGKARGSRGKGLRSITHAAFTVGLLEFARRKNRCHPGFVVLDTPLLAYREPEGDEDDLRGTDVATKFFTHLKEMPRGQVIILENVEPPEDVKNDSQTVFFTQNPHEGRYGFFPRS